MSKPCMPVLEVVAFYSKLHGHELVKNYVDRFTAILEKSGLVKYYKGLATSGEQVFPNARNLVVFPVTGGTSTAVFEASRNSVNVYMVYHEEHNSLASALNVASWLKQKGIRVSLISLKEFENTAEHLSKAARALESICGTRIPVVGGFPKWVEKTRIHELVESQFGVKFEVVRFEELGNWASQYRVEALKLAEDIASRASKIGVDRDNLVKASAFYYALKNLAESRGTRAVAVKCFDMLDPYRVTGCVGLAEFTLRNGVATCEADVHAAIAMLVLKELSGKDPWVANVSRVAPGELELSHCTISRNIVTRYNLVTHFESGLPVAVEGYVEPGTLATIVAYNSQKNLWRVTRARVVRGEPESKRKCRTQVAFKVSPEASKAVLEDPVEGHYIVVFADVFKEVTLVGELAGLNVQPFDLPG